MRKYPLEKEVQSSILEWLRKKKWYAFKIPTTGTFVKKTGTYIPSALKGVSDIYAIKDGISMWIECKAKLGIVSEDQIKFMGEINRHGGCAFVARSIDDVEQKLNQLI